MEKVSVIIEWCNTNTGFISAILACLSLIVSIVAIGISIHVSRLPYVKKLLVKPTYYFTVPATDEGLSVTATNVGSRPIHIEHLHSRIISIIVLRLRSYSGDSYRIYKISDARNITALLSQNSFSPPEAAGFFLVLNTSA